VAPPGSGSPFPGVPSGGHGQDSAGVADGARSGGVGGGAWRSAVEFPAERAESPAGQEGRGGVPGGAGRVDGGARLGGVAGGVGGDACIVPAPRRRSSTRRDRERGAGERIL
jgi:hypothetical protein